MEFIRLTTLEGEKVLLNANRIDSILVGEFTWGGRSVLGARLWIGDDEWNVRETLDEIEMMLAGNDSSAPAT